MLRENKKVAVWIKAFSTVGYVIGKIKLQRIEMHHIFIWQKTWDQKTIKSKFQNKEKW